MEMISSQVIKYQPYIVISQYQREQFMLVMYGQINLVKHFVQVSA